MGIERYPPIVLCCFNNREEHCLAAIGTIVVIKTLNDVSNINIP
jgi:hypothetical protein